MRQTRETHVCAIPNIDPYAITTAVLTRDESFAPKTTQLHKMCTARQFFEIYMAIKLQSIELGITSVQLLRLLLKFFVVLCGDCNQ